MTDFEIKSLLDRQAELLKKALATLDELDKLIVEIKEILPPC